MPFVKYVGPFDEVQVDGVGPVKQGQTVEVSAELAGKPPSGEPFNKDGSESKSYHPGEGLLAQSDNWETASKGDKA